MELQFLRNPQAAAFALFCLYAGALLYATAIIMSSVLEVVWFLEGKGSPGSRSKSVLQQFSLLRYGVYVHAQCLLVIPIVSLFALLSVNLASLW